MGELAGAGNCLALGLFLVPRQREHRDPSRGNSGIRRKAMSTSVPGCNSEVDEKRAEPSELARSKPRLGEFLGFGYEQV